MKTNAMSRAAAAQSRHHQCTLALAGACKLACCLRCALRLCVCRHRLQPASAQASGIALTLAIAWQDGPDRTSRGGTDMVCQDCCWPIAQLCLPACLPGARILITTSQSVGQVVSWPHTTTTTTTS